MSHALKRTSPHGEQFIGTCIKCGLEGLTTAAALDPCPNEAALTDEEVLLIFIDGDHDEEA